MQIEERAVGDVVVLDLKGKITLGEGDELLKDKVNSLVNQGQQEDRAEPRGRARTSTARASAKSSAPTRP